MASRLPSARTRLRVTLLLATAAANGALASAGPGVGTEAPETPARWTERVRIRSGTAAASDRPGELVLRIVAPEDSGRLDPTGAGGMVGGDSPQDALPGRTIDGHPSPALTVMPAMAEAIVADYFRNAPDALPADDSTLHFMAHEWALIHQGDRRDAPEYRLDHLTFVEQRRADGTFVDAISCSDGDRSATLVQWQANDDALIREASQRIALDCVERLAARMPAFYPSPLAQGGPSARADGGVPPARVRIFGATGRGITMYTEATCNDYRDMIEVRRSNFRALGGLFGAAPPDNIVIGIPETDTVRNMESVLFSNPNYEEYEVPGGKPLLFEARIENTADYRCVRTLSAQFVATPGHDYEVEMDLAGRMCRLRIRQVHADGSLTPQPLRPGPMSCARPGDAAGIEPPGAGEPSP